LGELAVVDDWVWNGLRWEWARWQWARSRELRGKGGRSAEGDQLGAPGEAPAVDL